MTEEEWLACNDPDHLWLRGLKAVSDRKLRLFACACCRRLWDDLPDERSRKAVEVAEWFVEGQATRDELEVAWQAARLDFLDTGATACWDAAVEDSFIVNGATHAMRRARLREFDNIRLPWWRFKTAKARRGKVETAQCDLIREVFNPYRPQFIGRLPAFAISGTVHQVAQAIYTDRAFDRLPILADALEEAGCTDRAVLDHCRGPGPHVRGCWVVDLILGKS